MRYRVPRVCRQRGYSIVELMVAVTIGLFLLTGLFSILQSTRDTSTNQAALAQLQDNERIAVTMMSETLQEAGYYPNASTTLATSAFGTSTAFGKAGQLVVGGANPNGASYGETITVRYQNDATGTVLGCLGTADAVNIAHEYQFLIVPVVTNGTSVSTLECAKDGNTAVPLVANVTQLTFVYGVASNGATVANTYLTATQLNTNQANGVSPDWTDVYSVKMTLSFNNPLYGQPGQTGATMQFISFTRVVSIMSKNGVNT